LHIYYLPLLNCLLYFSGLCADERTKRPHLHSSPISQMPCRLCIAAADTLRSPPPEAIEREVDLVASSLRPSKAAAGPRLLHACRPRGLAPSATPVVASQPRDLAMRRGRSGSRRPNQWRRFRDWRRLHGRPGRTGARRRDQELEEIGDRRTWRRMPDSAGRGVDLKQARGVEVGRARTWGFNGWRSPAANPAAPALQPRHLSVTAWYTVSR
jgi:hypothetical protein